MTKHGDETKMSDMEAVQAALKGDRGDDQKRIAERGLATIATLLRKNADYGCSVWQAPVFAPGMEPGDAILVRMSDKVNRLATLLAKGSAGEVDESIDDTLTDLGAYSILYMARPVNEPDRLVTKTLVEVQLLNLENNRLDRHPLTCPNRGDDEHNEYHRDHKTRDCGILVATTTAWECPVCRYTQRYTA